MKKVMRPRYYCEFCNKCSGSGGHMRKRESQLAAENEQRRRGRK